MPIVTASRAARLPVATPALRNSLECTRDEGPPTELRARRDKFAFFEQQCSEITPGLFLGSDAVARNWETLEAAGITHVVNCVGFIYPAYFESKLTYKVLYLQGQSCSYILSAPHDAETRLHLQIHLEKRSLQSCMTPLTSFRYTPVTVSEIWFVFCICSRSDRCLCITV